ncbi:putative ribosomal N-acetyltransferase YdaF [compost metagenome]
MFTFTMNSEVELRLIEVRDAEGVYDQIHRNREYLTQWLPWASVSTLEGTKEFIQSELNRYAHNNGFNCGIFYLNTFIGCVGTHAIDWNNKKTSLGYWMGEAYQGRGIMTDAVRSLIEFGFQGLGLNRIEIRACTDNFKSRAIPERLGFIHEGTIRQAEFIKDKYWDHEVYGLLANEWKKCSST